MRRGRQREEQNGEEKGFMERGETDGEEKLKWGAKGNEAGKGVLRKGNR